MSKTVFVTGGARGIGRAVVERFYEADWTVSFHYHASKKAAQSLSENLSCATIRADLGDSDECGRLRNHLTGNPPDVLVNNAGVAIGDDAGNPDSGDWQKSLQVNLTAASQLTRATADAMDSGAIVNVTSIRGLPHGTRDGLAAYCASKSGLEGLTRSVAQDFAPAVRVNSVAPGFTDTDMIADLDDQTRREVIKKTPMGRLGQPGEIADAVYFVASDQASYITGHTLVIDGGYSVAD